MNGYTEPKKITGHGIVGFPTIRLGNLLMSSF